MRQRLCPLFAEDEPGRHPFPHGFEPVPGGLHVQGHGAAPGSQHPQKGGHEPGASTHAQGHRLPRRPGLMQRLADGPGRLP